MQLAARAGAHVIAAVGRPERGAGLRELGAAEIVVELAGLAPVYGVVENVGGALLAQAYALLEPDGWLQSVGQASLEPSCIDFERARQRGGGRIEAFNVFSHGGAFGGDLAALLGRVERGELDPQVSWRGPWTRLTEALDALRGRRVQGKAVLDIDGVARGRALDPGIWTAAPARVASRDRLAGSSLSVAFATIGELESAACAGGFGAPAGPPLP